MSILADKRIVLISNECLRTDNTMIKYLFFTLDDLIPSIFSPSAKKHNSELPHGCGAINHSLNTNGQFVLGCFSLSALLSNAH